jgi:hypothetical protein
MGEPRHLCQARRLLVQNSQLRLTEVVSARTICFDFSLLQGLGYKGRTLPVKHENEPD